MGLTGASWRTWTLGEREVKGWPTGHLLELSLGASGGPRAEGILETLLLVQQTWAQGGGPGALGWGPTKLGGTVGALCPRVRRREIHQRRSMGDWTQLAIPGGIGKGAL